MKGGCKTVLQENKENIKTSLDYAYMFMHNSWRTGATHEEVQAEVLRQIEFSLKQLEDIKRYFE